jgi:hypothetical protein
MTTPTPDIVQRLRHEDSMNPERDEYRNEVLGRAATTIEALREAVAARDEAIRVLGEEVRAWRSMPHMDHILASYWADEPDDEIFIVSWGHAVDANPIARAACEGTKGTD